MGVNAAMSLFYIFGCNINDSHYYYYYYYLLFLGTSQLFEHKCLRSFCEINRSQL